MQLNLDSLFSPKDFKLLELALLEIFTFYVRKNIQEKANDFENLQEGLKRLNLKGFFSFIKDM